MQRLAVNTGTRDARLTAECPAAGRAVWEAFSAMGTPATGAGFVYLTQQEIAAYCANYGTRFTAWELDMIRAFDRIAAGVSVRHQKAKN